jgi:hypothetical protein
VRTSDTSSSRPGASVSRFSARSFAHFHHRPGGEAGHWDAQRCAHSGADQEAELVSIVRTRRAQIGVHPATIDVQRDGQIDSQGRVRRWLRVEGKVKGTKVRFL